MKTLGYMAEPWFALLNERCAASNRSKVAVMLGISPAALSQVLNASGKYGTGEAKTDRIADRVLHTFGRFECPHLTEQAEGAQSVVITAEQCRAYAHRLVPIGSPRELQHWQSCQQCPHKAASAPPVTREVKPRKATEEGASE